MTPFGFDDRLLVRRHGRRTALRLIYKVSRVGVSCWQTREPETRSITELRWLYFVE